MAILSKFAFNYIYIYILNFNILYFLNLKKLKIIFNKNGFIIKNYIIIIFLL